MKILVNWLLAAQLENLVSEGVDFVQGISAKPFRVRGIYVVGGQVDYLPESYNFGNHDLDLVFKTNVQKLTLTPI
jgi:hypothetical protein